MASALTTERENASSIWEGRGGARERGDGGPGGVPSRIDGVSTLGTGHPADAFPSIDGATTGKTTGKTTRDDARSARSSAHTSTRLSRGAPLSIKRGRFRGHPKTFRPPDRELSGLNATDARVFVLAGAAASDPEAPLLLDRFLTHHVDVARVPASHVMVVVHAGEGAEGAEGADADAVDAMVSTLRERRVFHEVWEGEALLFSAVAHHWENHLANAGVDEEGFFGDAAEAGLGLFAVGEGEGGLIVDFAGDGGDAEGGLESADGLGDGFGVEFDFGSLHAFLGTGA